MKCVDGVMGHNVRPGKGKQIIRKAVSKGQTTLASIEHLLSTSQPRICIIRSLGGIGDVLMTTPALRAIKTKWPECHLTYGTDFKYINGSLKELLQHNPYIDVLAPHEAVRHGDYDFICDVTATAVALENKGGKNVPNRIDLFAEAIGVDLEETGHLPVYIITPEEIAWAKEKVAKSLNPAKRKIGVHVGATTTARSLPIEKVRELVIALSLAGFQVYVFDSTNRRGDKESWNMSGVTLFKDFGIRQVAALINEMDLLICPDSGLMHIAGALNKKMVTVWAGSDPNARINYYPNAIALGHFEFKCHPCWYNPKACHSTYPCIGSISTESIVNAVRKQLDMPLLDTKIMEELNVDVVDIIRRCGGIGDILCTTPAVAAYKTANPTRKIRIVLPAEYIDVYKNNPNVFEVVSLEDYKVRGRFRYDLTSVDAEAEVAALAKHIQPPPRKEIYLKTLGISSADIHPRIYLTQDEIAWAKDRLASTSGKTIIATPPYSAERYRCWPLENYIELFKLAQETLPDVIFMLLNGSRLTQNFPLNTIDLSGFPIRNMFALVNESHLVLTPDSAALHIAAAFGKPCVALFGPIGSRTRTAGYSKTTVLVSQRPCVPCWRNSSVKCKVSQSLSMSACMQDITIDSVLATLKEVVNNVKNTR